MKLESKYKRLLNKKIKMTTENKKRCRLNVCSLNNKRGKMRKIILPILFTVGCANFDSLSVDSISQVPNVGSITNTSVGNIDVAQAASAAGDIGKAAMVSEEEIAQMSLSLAKHSDSKNKVAPTSSSYGARLNKLVSKHRSEDGLNLNYKVYVDKEVNAFSLADGSIRVHSGLMDVMNDNELLAVIGHEIGHVKLGHSANRIRVANLASGVRKGVASTSSIAGAVANEGMLGGLFEKVITSQFSQSQETDSDEYSVEFMKRHGYDLNAEITAFNKLAEMEGKSSFADQILSSHPASEDRAKHLAEIIGSDSNVKIIVKKDSDAPKSEVAKNEATTENRTAKNEVETVAPKTALNSKHAVLKGSNSLAPGWYVQVTAKAEKDSATLVENELESYGFKASQQAALVNGVNYHRVVVGPFSQKAKAHETKQKVMESSITKEEPFVKLIK